MRLRGLAGEDRSRVAHWVECWTSSTLEVVDRLVVAIEPARFLTGNPAPLIIRRAKWCWITVTAMMSKMPPVSVYFGSASSS